MFHFFSHHASVDSNDQDAMRNNGTVADEDVAQPTERAATYDECCPGCCSAP